MTNYAINKNHPDFVAGGEDGSKRLLTEVLDELGGQVTLTLTVTITVTSTVSST